MKKIAVFTDCDLDGLGTMAVFKWYTGLDVDHQICSQSNFRKTFTKWAVRNNPDKFEKIYVFDLDVSQLGLGLSTSSTECLVSYRVYVSPQTNSIFPGSTAAIEFNS